MSAHASNLPRVLVIGGDGMLGRACVDELGRTGRMRVEFTDRHGAPGAHHIDVRKQPAALWDLLRPGAYSLIVNAVGILRPAMMAAGSGGLQEAIAINALFPHELADRAGEAGSPLVHISTDAVFAGRGGAPYDESSPPAPVDAYGAAKWLGEPQAPLALTIRCSIVGRRRGRPVGLVDWFLGQAAGARVQGFTDYRWTPATTRQTAALIAGLADADRFGRLRQLSPVFHFAPNPPLAKRDLLEALNTLRRDRVQVEPAPHPSGPVDLSLTSRFDEFRRLSPEPRPWSALLSEV